MKNIFFVLVALAALCAAQEGVVKYAGTTAGSPTWNIPDVDNNQACTTPASPTASPYVQFNITFATDGIREVIALAENSFKNPIEVFIYRGFSAATPCANLVYHITNNMLDGTSVPPIDDFPFFAAGTYIMVVSGGSDGGLFAVNIFPMVANGRISANGITNQWNYPSTGSTCGTSSSTALFGVYTWTQNSTGNFDVYALFFNTTGQINRNARIAFFNGTASISGLASDLCNNTATGAVFVQSLVASYAGAFIPNAPLIAGRTYTLAFSTSVGDDTPYYGIQIIPTRIRFLSAYPAESPVLFTQPTRGSSPCSTGSSTSNFDSTLFLTEQAVYIVDTGSDVPEPYTYFDSYSYLYAGSNTGVPGISAPTTCPIFASLISQGDTGDITPVIIRGAVPGVNYTAVVVPYSGRSPTSSNPAYTLFLFTGTPIGVQPTSPPTTPAPAAAAATGANTGAAGSGSTGTTSRTTGTNTGAAATGTGVNTGTNTGSKVTTTSSASINTVAFATFAIVCLAQLF